MSAHGRRLFLARSRKGKMLCAKRGHGLARVLFGTVAASLRRGERKLHPERAEIIRQIYARVISGETKEVIARAITSTNCPTPDQCSKIDAGKKIGAIRPWTGAMIGRVVASPSNKGLVIYNRRTKVLNPKTRKFVVVERPRSEWVESYVQHLQIVDDPVWDDANRIHALNWGRGGRSGSATQNLLAGKAFCAHCGSKLRFGSEPRAVLSCGRDGARRATGVQWNSCVGIGTLYWPDIERIVIDAVSEAVQTPGNVAFFREAYARVDAEAALSAGVEREALREEKLRLGKRMERLFDNHLDLDLPEALLKRKAPRSRSGWGRLMTAWRHCARSRRIRPSRFWTAFRNGSTTFATRCPTGPRRRSGSPPSTVSEASSSASRCPRPTAGASCASPSPPTSAPSSGFRPGPGPARRRRVRRLVRRPGGAGRPARKQDRERAVSDTAASRAIAERFSEEALAVLDAVFEGSAAWGLDTSAAKRVFVGMICVASANTLMSRVPLDCGPDTQVFMRHAERLIRSRLFDEAVLRLRAQVPEALADVDISRFFTTPLRRRTGTWPAASDLPTVAELGALAANEPDVGDRNRIRAVILAIQGSSPDDIALEVGMPVHNVMALYDHFRIDGAAALGRGRRSRKALTDSRRPSSSGSGAPAGTRWTAPSASALPDCPATRGTSWASMPVATPSSAS